MPRVSALKGEEKPEVSPEIVVPVMTGTHFHALDDKGRVIVPAKLRAGLTERFWMMIDENDNVAMYNYSTGRDVLEYCERQMAQNPGDEFIAAAVERITGAAELLFIEGESWRVSVSDILRFRAGIDKEIVTVGVLNKAVMWSRERWEEAQQKRESPEVRKAQAEMLRAAASGLKKPLAQPQEEQVEQDVAKRTGTDRAAAAPAGDGGRSTRVLTLSQLGR
jgi:MraZ protein